jgi:hypothetical protein
VNKDKKIVIILFVVLCVLMASLYGVMLSTSTPRSDFDQDQQWQTEVECAQACEDRGMDFLYAERLVITTNYDVDCNCWCWNGNESVRLY